MENDILKHRMAVIGNIEKSFGEDIVEKGFEDEVNPFEYAEWENSLTKAELDEFEKAKHKEGDMHPNGKWVWRESANSGKGDWRVANPKRGGGAKKTATASHSNFSTEEKKNGQTSSKIVDDNNDNSTFEKIRKTALSSPGITLFEEVKTEDGNRGIKIGNKASHSIHWFDEYKDINGLQYLLTLRKRLKRLEQKHDDNERLSKVKTSDDFWKYLQSMGEADPKRGLAGYDVKSFVKTAKYELQAERYLKDVEIPVTRYIINELNNKTH